MSLKKSTFVSMMLLACLLSLPSFSINAAQQGAWEEWVAERHSDLNCPWIMSSDRKKVCHWPGEFIGHIVRDGMSFKLSVEVFSREAFVNLPGSKKQWPSDVTVNQQSATVDDNNGTPRIQLNKGSYIIRGKFLWQQIPPFIAFPDEIGLVKIVKDGKVWANSIKNNQLIFSMEKEGGRIDNHNTLKIQAYHAIEDGVPVRLTSIIKLAVSGKSREIKIGQAAIAGTKNIYLQSALPARLEDDGMLRVQVKPGIHQITIGSRFINNVTSLATNKISPEWPLYEYFSFVADPLIREVTISGVKSIDTSLIDIPSKWKAFPTYRLEKSQKLRVETTIRGDSGTHLNSININREIWLPFNGKEATVKDNISGIMHQGWRLDADQTVELGRATVNGTPVLITQYGGHQGVEVRSPQINLQAVSSLPLVNTINAVGWQTDAAKLTAKIHLPPGWRAVYASGVDGIRGTWIQKWNLWDIFWLMILIAAANKLLGVKGALLMAVTLVFTFHEDLAPNSLWATLFAFIALIKLPIGKYKILLSRLALLPAMLLVITFISIAISSLRLAIYPALEKHGVTNYQTTSSAYQQNMAPESPLLMEEMDVAVMRSKQSQSQAYQRELKTEKQELYQIGDNDRVQTGPGIPTWSWNALYINSSGTVTAEQQIHLILSSPMLTSLWRITNVLLIALMAVLILRGLFNVSQFKSTEDLTMEKKEPALSTNISTVIMAILMPLLFSLIVLSPRIADAAIELPSAEGYPPEYLLKEYENRLLKSPACLPSCVSLNNGLLLLNDNQLTLSFELFANADIAMPLPSAGKTWQPEKITIDNKPAVLSTVRGNLTVYLPKGAHYISLQGEINNAEMTINLPQNIHNFKVDAPSWLVDGIRNGVVVNNSISLTSKEILANQAINTLTPLPAKPYALVHRKIILGKEWRMLTRVEKVAPTVDAASFNIALLKDEQILSAYPINENGSVNVQIPKNRQVISWQSALPQSKSINLIAQDSRAYSETWQVIPSSIWHVTFSGIKPIKSALASEQLQPLWKPWPGESLSIDINRPEGVTGEIFTTEMVKLVQQSGKNVQKSKLMLKVLASQGTGYEIILAEGVKINSLSHDGNKMSINSGNRALVQLHPGEQNIELEFEKRSPLTFRNSSPEIKLPGKSVNINIEYQLLRDRWLIYLNGPSLGAAMLYWGVLLVILIAASVLPVLARKWQLKMPITGFGWILLGLGFSTVNSYGLLFVALFFFLMAFRKQFVNPAAMTRWQFNLLQLTLLALTVIAVISLLVSIPIGLLSSPEMQVVGNGSYGHLFKFFQDNSATGTLPIVSVYSLPIWFYRVVMLAWSLWIATRLIAWGKWWFASYSQHGAWIAKPKKVEKKEKVTIELESDSE